MARSEKVEYKDVVMYLNYSSSFNKWFGTVRTSVECIDTKFKIKSEKKEDVINRFHGLIDNLIKLDKLKTHFIWRNLM